MALDLLDHPIAFSKPRRLTSVWGWHAYIPFGMYLVDLLRPEVIVELGTYRGDSYCALCQAVDELGLATRCYAVDTWLGDEQSGIYGPEVIEELREHHDPRYGSFSSLMQMQFDEALERFDDGSIDLLHIDGNHTYEAVSHDFNAWLPKVSDRGVVMLHDTNKGRRDFGVWRLWSELESRYPTIQLFDDFGLGVVVVGPNPPAEVEELTSLTADEETRLRGAFSALGSAHRVRGELQTAHGEIEELTGRLTDVGRQAHELRGEHAALSARYAELEFEHSRLVNSRTVRWMAPARAMMTRLRAAGRRLRRRQQPGGETDPAGVRQPDGGPGQNGPIPDSVRTTLAARYLQGSGIEIGALHLPLQVPPEVKVRYVDRMGVDELREHYPEFGDAELVEPDIVDDGEQLGSISADSLDFVIANHFLEHCEDPIATLGNHIRVLRPGGVLFLTLPDKRVTFDRDRPLTSLEHLIRDHDEGPERSRLSHFEEWARHVEGVDDNPSERAAALLESGYSIHYHVWTPSTFLEFLSYCRRELSPSFELKAFQSDPHEFIAVLGKLPVD